MQRKPNGNRSVVCVAYDNLSLFEAGIASEVFGLDRPEFPRALYLFRIVQADPGVLRARGGLQLRTNGGLRLLGSADVVIIPGWRGTVVPDALLRALRRAHQRGAELLSICTGAFVLAEAGLLDGRAATTHWRYVPAFRERFPAVDWRPDVLYVDAGSILTSAGSAAGIDACLHLVRRHHGSAVANLVARTMVTPPHRQAGQAQFIPMPIGPTSRSGVGPVLDWARENLNRPLRISDLADRAAMSERNFLRRFSAQVGIGPKEWLRRERVAAAQALLERSSQRLEAVAQAVGFGSASALRTAFRETVGVSPAMHRRQFGASE